MHMQQEQDLFYDALYNIELFDFLESVRN